MWRLVPLLFVLLLVAGCKKAATNTPTPTGPAPVVQNQDTPPQGGAVPGAGANPHVNFRPQGGSSTLPGRIRDRALDTKIMAQMRDVYIGLEADGVVPGSKDAWITFLRDYATIRELIQRDEIVAFTKVTLRQPNTVLMYEKRIEKDNDGIVLLADGTPHRMNKAQFDQLTKPRE